MKLQQLMRSKRMRGIQPTCCKMNTRMLWTSECILSEISFCSSGKSITAYIADTVKHEPHSKIMSTRTNKYYTSVYDLLKQCGPTGSLRTTSNPRSLVIKPAKLFVTLLLDSTRSFISLLRRITRNLDSYLVCCFTYKYHTYYWLSNLTITCTFSRQIQKQADVGENLIYMWIYTNLCTFQ
jgi:hypothetical protein